MDGADVLGLLRRRWIALALCLIASLAGAVAITHQTAKSYRASTVLIVNLPNSGTSGEALQALQLSTQLLKSYATIATSLTAAEKVRERLGLTESASSVRSRLQAAPATDTLLMTISAQDASPAQAQRLADATAAVFIASVADLERGKGAKVTPSVVDPAVASGTPVSPRPKLNLGLGAFVGLVLGSLLALLLEALDRSLTRPQQVQEAFGAPVLAVVPTWKATGLEPSLTTDARTTRSGEAYRALRTSVRFIRPDHPVKTILVTSASQGEGKTVTATNLALAFAQSGDHVLLIDADLRRGRVLEIFGLPTGVGLTSVVMRAVPLPDAIISWRDLLGVLGTGPLPPNPSEILGSSAMLDLLSSACELADIVIIDSPPVLPVTDAVELSTQVDGVIAVARAGRTSVQSAVEARRRLESVGAAIVGCVLNDARRVAIGDYAQRYQYDRRKDAPNEPGRS